MKFERNLNVRLADVPAGESQVTSEKFVSYYTKQFAQELRRFYHIVNDFGDRSYPFVLQMNSDEYENRDRVNMVWADRQHYYMFSAAVYYMSMCTQVVGKLYGWSAMEDFMRASGWPMLSCGMGGLMHPVQTVWESGLQPFAADDDYIGILRTAGEYLKKDFVEFFKPGVANVNSSAHSRLLSVVDVADLSAEFDRQQVIYCNWITDPDAGYDSYYVPYPVDEK